MNKKSKTSFIPKNSLQDSVEYKPKGFKNQKNVNSLGFRLMTLIFITILLISGGVFVYTGILVKAVEKQEHALKELHNEFNESDVQSFVRKEHRIRHVTSLLESHLAPSEIFTQLELVTLKDISFEKFQYGWINKGDTLEVGVTGVAKSFQSVAQQVEQFEKHDAFFTPFVSLLEFTEDGQVRFGLIVTLDPGLVLYTKQLGNEHDAT